MGPEWGVPPASKPLGSAKPTTLTGEPGTGWAWEREWEERGLGPQGHSQSNKNTTDPEEERRGQ